MWRILLFSRSPSLAVVNRALHSRLRRASPHIKTEYLLCCWLDSYALRFTGGTRADASIPQLAPKFVPTTAPATGRDIAQKRAATCDVLSYIVRFGLCTAKQLDLAQRKIIRTRMCGNVVQLHGRFSRDAEAAQALIPGCLACHVVPERVFRDMRAYDVQKELSGAPPSEHAHLEAMYNSIIALVPADVAPEGARWKRPPLAQLELIVRLVLIHQASVNSNQGFGLAMAVYMDCVPLVCFLLACGADPTHKNGIALQIAAKRGSLHTLRLLVERDERVEHQWTIHLRAITHELHELSRKRTSSTESTPSGPQSGASAHKRRRLADRCTLDVSLLKAAVRGKSWDLVRYLMEQKSIVPDVETLRLLDLHGMP